METWSLKTIMYESGMGSELVEERRGAASLWMVPTLTGEAKVKAGSSGKRARSDFMVATGWVYRVFTKKKEKNGLAVEQGGGLQRRRWQEGRIRSRWRWRRTISDGAGQAILEAEVSYDKAVASPASAACATVTSHT